MDAAPQSHVKSTKKEYPTKRKVMGYPTSPVAPLNSNRRRRKDRWGDRSNYQLSLILFFLLSRAPLFWLSTRLYVISTGSVSKVLAKC